MHALRQIHQALVPGGILLDLHPIPPSTRAEVQGRSLGEFDDSEFMQLVADGEAVLERSGLFTRESEVEFDYLERYDDPAEMLDDIREDWETCRVPAGPGEADPRGRGTGRHLGARRPTPFPRGAQVTLCY